MTFSTTSPILRIFDVDKAKEHYVSFLGFHLDWEHRFGADFPLYCQISRDTCVLHLSEHHGDACPGSAVRIEVCGLSDYAAALTAKNYRFAKPRIEKMPWGTNDLAVTDPFGNRLIFGKRYKSSEHSDVVGFRFTV